MAIITKPTPRSWRPKLLELLKSKSEGITRREIYEALEVSTKRDQTIILNTLIAMRKENEITVSNGIFRLPNNTNDPILNDQANR
jgi:hypothetical protein